MVKLHQAQLRTAGYYLTVLRTAGELYDQGGEALMRGLNLFEVEWVNIEAGQRWSEVHSVDSEQVAMVCSSFPDAAPRLLDLRQRPRDRIRWLEAALNAAQQLDDQIAVGRHLNFLGLAYSHLGELVRAIELFKASLEIYQLRQDRRAQGELLTNIGVAYANLSEPSLSITVSEQALAIAREHADRRSEAVALGNLGQSYYLRGEPGRAIEFYEQSLRITREIGYFAGESIVLNYLGKALIRNKPKQAIEFYEQALEIANKINDRQGQRNALGSLGHAYHLMKEVNRAIELYERALLIARELGGDPLVEAEFLHNLGDAYLEAGESEQALRSYQARLKITLEFNHRRSAHAEDLFHDWFLRSSVTVSDDETPKAHSDGSQTRISWLHLSDFHFGGSQSKRYDEDVVIESLLDDIGERIKQHDLEPNFIAVTGDLALKGKSTDYELVRSFFDELLKITGLPRQRLFIVPGNHDVDRDLITHGALALGKDLTDRQITKDVLHSPDDRRLLFARFKGYSEFFNDYFKGHLIFNDERFFYVHPFDIGDRRLAILGLNSSWLAASDEDEVLKLVIGEPQTRTALRAAKEASAVLRIALLHHPNDWIRGFDQSDSMTRVLTDCDFVLHGHLHKSSATHLSTPDGSAMVIAGGACYESREFPNSYNYVKLDFESNTGTINFREYADQQGGFWAKGVRLYKNVPDGVYEFKLPSR
ncbi:MAG TPA: tetratricopeptide repeat protein [Pyrinomonadaceae bacterium]|nr:tetratricopeptide repeat protein [Pyrinomonadaceae bacterium]